MVIFLIVGFIMWLWVIIFSEEIAKFIIKIKSKLREVE